MNLYIRNAKTGGASGAIDALDGYTLANLDAVIHIDATGFDFYLLDALSGEVSDGVEVISPAINAGTKRWIRKSLASRVQWANVIGKPTLAELDATGRVPAAQLPSYVDDVLEFAAISAFPATGETGKIYVALDSNVVYRWSGSTYVEISQSLAIGETSSTAYRGDRGKSAYDHAQATGNPHGTSKVDIGLENVDNTRDADKPVSTLQQLALEAKLNVVSGLSASSLITGPSVLTSNAFGLLHVCSGTTGNYQVTLPAVSGNGGKVIGIVMSPSLTMCVTIKGNASEQIDGRNTRIMWSGESAVLYCDGTAWTKIGGKTLPMRIGLQATESTSIPTSVLTKVNLHGVLSNNAPAAASDGGASLITILRPGLYDVGYSVRYIDISAAATFECALYRSGALAFITCSYPPGPHNFPTVGASAPMSLAAGDVLSLYARQYAGSSNTIGGTNAGVSETFLVATEIATW